jgi:hypothetical protein
MRRSAAPSQIANQFNTSAPSLTHTANSSLKRKSKADKVSSDDENENEEVISTSKSRSRSSGVGQQATGTSEPNEWSKFRENLKKAKNSKHDNYDASSFVSKYRQPLNNVSLNTSTFRSTTIESASSKSHVRFFFLHFMS